MGRGVATCNINKNYVLSKVSQITIFSTYFDIPIEQINYCIETGNTICSPIREDKHPTCGFAYNNNGKLKMRDFAGYFWGDCFDAVAFVLSNIKKRPYNVSNKNDFIEILKHIVNTFKDIFYGKEKDPNITNDIKTSLECIRKQKAIIELVIRDWNKNDKKYWSQFNIDFQTLNTNFIYPIDQYYINRKVNPEPKYYYNPKDPCYGYLLGVDRHNIHNIKLYFPYRKHSETRFITNCNHLEGIYNFDRNDYEYILITKSTKDRLALKSAINDSFTGEVIQNKIGLINIPHETYHIRDFEYEWIKSKTSENCKIVSLMDNDETGIKESKYLRDTFDIIPLLIPRKYGNKDFAEFVSNHSKEEINQLIQQTITYINNYENKKDIWNKEKSDSKPF